jgi:hypothetical protein
LRWFYIWNLKICPNRELITGNNSNFAIVWWSKIILSFCFRFWMGYYCELTFILLLL